MEDPEVIFRLFDEEDIAYAGPWSDARNGGKSLFLSHYMPAGILLGLVLLASTDYVLCPYYSKGDVQIGVTGRLHERESNEQGLVREVAEEVGRFIVAPESLPSVGVPMVDRKRVLASYLVSIDRTTLVPLSYGGKPGKDLKTKGIAALVHGTVRQMNAFLSTPSIYRPPNEDDILGVVAMRVDVAQRLAKAEKAVLPSPRAAALIFYGSVPDAPENWAYAFSLACLLGALKDTCTNRQFVDSEPVRSMISTLARGAEKNPEVPDKMAAVAFPDPATRPEDAAEQMADKLFRWQHGQFSRDDVLPLVRLAGALDVLPWTEVDGPADAIRQLVESAPEKTR